MKDFYYILGLDKNNCTDSDIKTAFRRLSKKFHPDHNDGDRYYEIHLKNVSEAHETLTKNRLIYDKKLNDYIFARTYSQPNYSKPSQKPPVKRTKAEQREYDRQEWEKNNPPKKPFSDPIFKKK